MGAESIIHWVDEVTGSRGYLVIDRTVNGLADGGLRMQKGLTCEQIKGIAHTMALKCRAVGMPTGGAKGGIDFPGNNAASEGVLTRFMQHVYEQLENTWITASDLGTTDEQIRQVARSLGLTSSIHAIKNPVAERRYHEALDLACEGINLGRYITGFGVAAAISSTIGFAGKRISIQGFGTVGACLARLGAESGARIVAISDEKGVITAEGGLDIAQLSKHKDQSGCIDRTKLDQSKVAIHADADQWLRQEADIYVPAAIHSAINQNNASLLQGRSCLIAEASNRGITESALGLLKRSPVQLIPDFICGSGAIALDAATLATDTPIEPQALLNFTHERIASLANKILALPECDISLKERAAQFILNSPEYDIEMR